VTGKNGVDALGTFDQLVTGIEYVFGIQAGVVVPSKTILDGVRQLAGNQDDWLIPDSLQAARLMNGRP
jgi:hypothetical protein